MKTCFKFFIALLFFVASCSSDENTNNVQDARKVLVAGVEKVNNVNYPRLWVNGQVQLLGANDKEGRAEAIFLDGNDIYVAGYEKNTSGKAVAKYWKNGGVVNLTNGSFDAYATCIVKSPSGIIVVGGYQRNANGVNVPTLWFNGAQFTINNNNLSGKINSLTFVAQNAFIAVGETMVNGVIKGTYWTNDDYGYLNNSNSIVSVLNDIIIHNDNVAMIGAETNLNQKLVALNTVNGLVGKNYLTDGSNHAIAYKAFVNSNNLYIAGYELNSSNVRVAKFWKNGTETILSNGPQSEANDVVVSNNDVFVCGYYNNGQAIYWKNGVAQPLSTNESNALSIAIKN